MEVERFRTVVNTSGHHRHAEEHGFLEADHRAKGREGSHCRTCAHTVIDFRLKTTSGGFRRGMGKNVLFRPK